MSYEAERKLIELYIRDNWDVPNVPILYDNSKQAKPSTDYVFVRIVYSRGKQAEIGSINDKVTMRYEGLLQADIMAVPETGTAKANEYADKFAEMFRRKQFSDTDAGVVTFKVPSKTTFGQYTGTDRWRVAVSCPFDRDVIE